MRIALIGADVEENLGLGMISAALERARHRVRIVPYNDVVQVDDVVRAVRHLRPHVVGLGIQFQFRAHDFLLLARRLREAGCRAHVTCGGQYPSVAYAEVLAQDSAIDSIVLYEGEETMVDLVEAIQGRSCLADVPGLALRDAAGRPVRTAPRPLCQDLDALPFVSRYRAPTQHLGIPFLPVWGSRGCWGHCAFCAITTFYRDARRYAGGKQLRLRSPENLADEMAALWRRAGGPCIFCFHDDTFLLPRPGDSLARIRALRHALTARGVGKVGFVGKCRPETLTLELAEELRSLGVFRLYVGVENGSQPGQDHLGRRTTTAVIEQALRAMQEADIFGCYNLLMFEPDTTLDDIRDNLSFMRRHPEFPVNFCRAEPYHRTPLYERVRERGLLGGSYLGWDYRIVDARVELLHRICAAAFNERNFDPYGVANRYMGLGYMAQVVKMFFDSSSTEARSLMETAARLTRAVTLDTADFLEEAITIAETADLSDDRVLRQTAHLALRVAAHDRVWHGEFDDLFAGLTKLTAGQRGARTPRRRATTHGLAVAAVALAAQGCGGKTDGGKGGAPTVTAGAAGFAGDDGSDGGSGGVVGDPVVGGSGGGWYDPVPPEGGTAGMVPDPPLGGSGGGWYDPVPPDGGTGGIVGDPVVGGSGGGWYDPVPPEGGTGGIVGDPAVGGSGGGWYDPVPPDGGTGGIVGDPAVGGSGGGWYDPVPVDGGMGGIIVDPVVRGPGGGWHDQGRPEQGAPGVPVVDPAPAPGAAVAAGAALTEDDAMEGRRSLQSQLVDHWRNTMPTRAIRSTDLPMAEPPVVRLAARRSKDGVRVTLLGGGDAMTIRWEGDGAVEGESREVLWHPITGQDQLRVAVRTAGGVAVASVRACKVA